MKPRLFYIFFITTFSCNQKTKELKTLDFGQFSLTTPQDWIILKSKGMDSYVGGLTNGNDTLWFDYGAFELNLDNEDIIDYQMAVDTINGKEAFIYISSIPTRKLIVMQMQSVHNDKKFTIGGNNIKNTNLILKIFKSVVFSESSDTSYNSELDMTKFKKVNYLSPRKLIIMNCFRCHLSLDDYKSLPLDSFVQSRSIHWLYNFLTNKKQIQVDSLFIQRRQNNQTHCPEFPNLTITDIVRIKAFYK